ncbi:stage III sporulation protein AD [Phosphitispora fastidiosa]|uniref:stage III sporulation protein AD n=1 Tax=Phosphitispora fastidiosa TaxID=2837202 RepID=UPI001E5D4FE0|nr:stage III sporulation protein AD [Phosphitispora fastidiosa]MBU7007629.1 stage III sporulation protein AD [Phosphitispora fastidiosa]
MEIIQIVGLGIVVTILIVIIKQQRPELAIQLSVITGVVIFSMMLGKINSVVTLMKDLAQKSNVSVLYMGTIMKIIGVAYIAEFGAQICRDAGEGAVASKIEFAAKVIVIVLAIPVIVAVFDSLLKLIP